jgi:hypothetical protein
VGAFHKRTAGLAIRHARTALARGRESTALTFAEFVIAMDDTGCTDALPAFEMALHYPVRLAIAMRFFPKLPLNNRSKC